MLRLTLETCLRTMTGLSYMFGMRLNSSSEVTMQTSHETERSLPAVNSMVSTLTATIGPTCDFTASQCPGGGWLIMSDGKPYAACTEPWEVPEIMGRVMAAKFDRSFTRPVEYGGDAPPKSEDQLPRIIRRPSAPLQQSTRLPDPNGATPARASVMLPILILVTAAAVVGSLFGV